MWPTRRTGHPAHFDSNLFVDASSYMIGMKMYDAVAAMAICFRAGFVP